MTPLTGRSRRACTRRSTSTRTPWRHDLPGLLGHRGDGLRGPRPAPAADRHGDRRRSRSTGRRPHAPAELGRAVARPSVQDRVAEYLTDSPRPAAPRTTSPRARPRSPRPTHPARGAPRRCAALVRDEVEYVPGATARARRAAEAWAQRKGVCQDMAHLAVGALRSIGIPARYVSGYLHPRRSAESARWSPASRTPGSSGGRGSGSPSTRPTTSARRPARRGRPRPRLRRRRAPRGIFAGGRTSRMVVDVRVTRVA